MTDKYKRGYKESINGELECVGLIKQGETIKVIKNLTPEQIAIINQKNELDNVSYAAPLVKYKTFLEHFTDNRENHSFLMKTSAAFRSLFKDVNKLWFKTYKVPGEVTGIATQESLSIIPKAVPSNFYKNQMAIKKILLEAFFKSM